MAEKELIDALLCGKPYFGPALRALQGPPIRHLYLRAIGELAAKLQHWSEIRILEIGSWAGASAITWATAINNLGRQGKVICVDHWKPYFDEGLETALHYQEMNEAAKDGKMLKLFLHNLGAANVSHIVEHVVGNARDVLPKMPDANFDIVYIDGAHVYESVRADIQDGKRLVRDGGIICGDDLELQKNEVDPREHKAVVELRKDYVQSHVAGREYHPGVTEAIASEFGEVSVWEGIWAMRKTGAEWSKIELEVKDVLLPDHITGAAPAMEVTEVGDTRDYIFVRAHGRFVAVTKIIGKQGLFAEKLGERELPPLVLTGANLEELRKKAAQLEEETRPVGELVGQTAKFNIVKVRNEFVAVAKSIGPTNLLVDRLGERDVPPLLFVSETAQEAREKAESTENTVELVDQLGDYNLVKARDCFIAIAKQLGPVNLFQERLGERDLPPFILLSSEIASLRERILTLIGSGR